MTIVVQGWDVSPNHAACVELEASESDFVAYAPNPPATRMRWWSFASQTWKSVHRYGHRGVYLPDLPKVGKHVKSIDHIVRLSSTFDEWSRRLASTKSARGHAVYAAIEDYAVAADQGAHYIGEIGGVARLALCKAGVPFQLLPIKGTKKAVAGNGNAEKTDVAKAVVGLGIEFPDDLDEQTLEDLHDAASIAQTMMLLLAARARVTLPRHVREVMSSKSKAAPVPLCERDFLLVQV